MEKIFLKNYKGFKHQVIELSEMNFLVGENSTGKTSILKIINLLSSSEFWYNFEFNNNEVELGYFEEILDKRSPDDFFQLGYEKYIDEDDPKEKKRLYRVIYEFSEQKSVPALRQIKATIGNFELLIKFTEKQITYKVKEKKDNSFNDWVSDFDFPKSYKKLGIQFKEIPTSILMGYIEREINSGNSKNQYYRGLLSQEKLLSQYKWLAPIRAKAKRTYESYKVKFSPEGEHIPSILRQILMNKSSKEKNEIITILEQFGKESNLFDKIVIRELGGKNSSPFEIIVLYNDIEVKLPNVGYGVSQSLPLIIEILSTKHTSFSIQQPEVHLHPKAQSAFGSFLFNSIINDSNKFIIETHSDFTINRFRYKLLTKKKRKKKEEINSKVLFFERTKNGNTITEILINNDGSYKNELPDSYRDFFIDEELKLLEL
jgi:predicted ATP-dependent endonuclease of OLD family